MSTGKSGILRGFEIMGNYLKLFEIIWNYVGKLVLKSEIMGKLFGIIPSGCFVRNQHQQVIFVRHGLRWRGDNREVVHRLDLGGGHGIVVVTPAGIVC